MNEEQLEDQKIVEILQTAIKDLNESQDIEIVRQAGQTILMFSYYQFSN